MTVTVDEEAGMASVEISSLDRNHAGYYRCDATNTLGDNTGKAMLIVTGKLISYNDLIDHEA